MTEQHSAPLASDNETDMPKENAERSKENAERERREIGERMQREIEERMQRENEAESASANWTTLRPPRVLAGK